MTFEPFDQLRVLTLRAPGIVARRLGPGLTWLSLAGLVALPAHALAVDPGAPTDVAPAPSEAPPALPAEVPKPPAVVAEPPAADSNPAVTQAARAAPTAPRPPAASPADGQWAYTRQYGWVWMPYGQAYTYVPSDGYPAMYVYGPALGWRWVAAPWVFDWGPAPYWGVSGRARFAWYSRPWFAHRPYYREPHYRESHGRGRGPVREVHVHDHRAGHGHRR